MGWAATIEFVTYNRFKYILLSGPFIFIDSQKLHFIFQGRGQFQYLILPGIFKLVRMISQTIMLNQKFSLRDIDIMYSNPIHRSFMLKVCGDIAHLKREIETVDKFLDGMKTRKGVWVKEYVSKRRSEIMKEVSDLEVEIMKEDNVEVGES